MLLRTVLILVLANLAIAQCNTGCLKCSASNQCLFCDSSAKYILVNGACTTATDTNCAIFSQSGNCVQCNFEFYLDPNTSKCVAVSPANAGKNCAFYSATQACVTCKPGYFPSGGACTTIVNAVSNCLLYLADAKCSACSQGYVLALNGTACVSTSTSPNCLFYTFATCQACVANFTMNANSYFTNFASLTYLDRLINYDNTNNINLSSAIQLSVCQGGSISNCVEYSNPVTCIRCATNFFLQNNACFANPLPVIFACTTYTSLTTCSNCKTGFYLSQNKCNANEVITNCVTYSTTTSTTTCTACDAANFLQNNACVARVNSATIQNCQVLNPNSDVCQTCSSGFQITSDNLGCLTEISNCATYRTGTTKDSTAHQCDLCVAGYFLSTDSGVTSCTQGTVQNCLTFATSADTCQVCKNGFYLNNNLCVAHVNIQGCATYHPSASNTCSTCSSGFYNFKFDKVCATVNQIAGCLTYANDGLTCTACSPGFYIQSSQCTQIPQTFTNCVTFSGTDCTACAPNFMVNNMVTPKVCVAPFDYLTTNCILKTPTGTAVWANPATNPLVCDYCGPNMRAYIPSKAEAVCVMTTQLPLYAGFTAVDNCLRYGTSYSTTPTIICMQCGATGFLSGYKFDVSTITATTCVTSCSTSDASNVIIPDDLLGFVNVCVPTTRNSGTLTVVSCQKMVRTTGAAKAQGDFMCISPATGFVLNYAFSGIDFEPNDLSIIAYKTTSLDYSEGFTIADGVGNTVLPLSFNHKGLRLTSVATPTLITGVSLANCDIVWTIGSGVFKGSGFRSGGGSTGGYTALTGTPSSCLRCNFGFRPQFNVVSTSGNVALPNCVTMSTNCLSTSVIYGGLPMYLNAVLSCHSCGQSSGQPTFPTIFMDIDATTGSAQPGVFLQFSLPLVAGWTTSTPQGFSCAVQPATVVTANAAPTAGNAVANCAVFGVFSAITAYSADPSAGNINSFCLACSTGYYPIYFGARAAALGTTTYIPPFAVTSCAQSNKCDPSATNTPFNSCGRCTKAEENQPSPVYYGYSDFRLINCLPVITRNCYILNTENSITLSASSPNFCSVCLAGFFKNEDNFCESLTVPNQISGATFTNSYYVNYYTPLISTTISAGADAIQIRIAYQLSFFSQNYGISACNTGYTLAVPSILANGVCVVSSYVTANAYPQTTFFIPNCLRYFYALASNRLNCEKCQTGFIPTSSYLSCVMVVPNCVFAQTDPNASKCATCMAGYRNVGGVCSTGIIPNCLTYNNNEASFSRSVLTCSGCASGFFLSTDQLTCSAGSVLNCKTYAQNSATSCTECLPKFMKLTLTGSVYCYLIPDSLNCQILADQSASTASNAKVTCTTCASTASQIYGVITWNPTTTSAQAQTICMPFNTVERCVAYSQSNNVLAQNSFACTGCSNGYFYNPTTRVCVLRQVLPSNCNAYNPTADLCTGCSGTSFLAANGLSCVSYPTGIFNCLVYSSNTTCVACASGSYLSGNQCLTSTFISNCQTYSGNNICKACVSGFFLQNPTTCVQATATGCLNYTSASACAACPPGSTKVVSNGVTNCVSANVPNCASINDTVTPPVCSVCNSGFFVSSSGACQAVPSQITNCLVYDSNITCSVCAQGSVLSEAKTNCVLNGFPSMVDPNCAQSAVSSTPQCAVCALGYYFVNGTCQGCTGQTLQSGCWSCDPNNSTLCIMCKTGYYQNAAGSCVSMAAPAPTPVTPTTPNSTVAGPLKVFWLTTALVAFGWQL